MKKHKPKKKRALRNPPLSFLDKTIYIAASFLTLLPLTVLIYTSEMLHNYFVCQFDASVVAVVSRLTIIWPILFLLFLAITVVFLIVVPYANKKPIFGNKEISYGVYPWTSDCYPRFGKRGRKPVLTEEKKKIRRIKIIAWLIVFVILLSVTPFGMYGRKCLYEDSSITYYNMANKSYVEYDTEDFSHLNIKTGWQRTGSIRLVTGYWYYAIEIEMKDGEKLWLDHSDFRYDYNHEQTLIKMLEIKKLFKSDEITIIRDDDVEVVIDELDMNEKETILINELFDIK